MALTFFFFHCHALYLLHLSFVCTSCLIVLYVRINTEYIYIYMFVVHFDARTQASDFRIERWRVTYMHTFMFVGINCVAPRVSEPESPADWKSADKPTYIHTYLLLLISMLWHRQAIFKSKGNKLCSSAECRIWTRVHTYIHTYIHTTYIHTCLLLISMLWHRQAIFESKGDKLSSSAECRIRTQRVSETQSSADWMPADKPTELSRNIHTYIHTYIQTYTHIHTYIHTFIFKDLHWHREHLYWKVSHECCDGFKSNIWDGFPLRHKIYGWLTYS